MARGCRDGQGARFGGVRGWKVRVGGSLFRRGHLGRGEGRPRRAPVPLESVRGAPAGGRRRGRDEGRGGHHQARAQMGQGMEPTGQLPVSRPDARVRRQARAREGGPTRQRRREGRARGSRQAAPRVRHARSRRRLARTDPQPRRARSKPTPDRRVLARRPRLRPRRLRRPLRHPAVDRQGVPLSRRVSRRQSRVRRPGLTLRPRRRTPATNARRAFAARDAYDDPYVSNGTLGGLGTLASLAVLYFAYKNGASPYTLMMIANALGLGGGRRRGMGYGYGGFPGMGYGGMGRRGFGRGFF